MASSEINNGSATTDPFHKIQWNNTPVISQLNIAGTSYYLKDAEARDMIELLHTTGAMHFMGVALNNPLDKGINNNPIGNNVEVGYSPVYVLTTGNEVVCYYYGNKPADNPVNIGDRTYNVIKFEELTSGDVFLYGDAEVVFSELDEQFHRLGTSGSFKAFAYADKGKVTLTPEGTVNVSTQASKYNLKNTAHTVTTDALTSTGKFTPAGSIVATKAPTTDDAIKNFSTEKKYLDTTTIKTGITTSSTDLTTENIHTGISKTTKYVVTKNITEAGAKVSVPNVQSTKDVSIPNVKTNSEVTASHVTAGESIKNIATVGSDITAIKSITAPAQVAVDVTAGTTSVMTAQTAAKSAFSVSGETLNIPVVDYLNTLNAPSTTTVVNSVTPVTEGISSTPVSFKSAGNATEVPTVNYSDVKASKVTLGEAISATQVVMGDDIDVATVGSTTKVATGELTDTDNNNASVITSVQTSGSMNVVTGLAGGGTKVLTSASVDKESSVTVVTGLTDKPEGEEEANAVVTGVSKSGTFKAVTAIGEFGFNGAEGQVTVSGKPTITVSHKDNVEVVQDVTVSATFTGTQTTHDVTPVV